MPGDSKRLAQGHNDAAATSDTRAHSEGQRSGFVSSARWLDGAPCFIVLRRTHSGCGCPRKHYVHVRVGLM